MTGSAAAGTDILRGRRRAMIGLIIVFDGDESNVREAGTICFYRFVTLAIASAIQHSYNGWWRTGTIYIMICGDAANITFL